MEKWVIIGAGGFVEGSLLPNIDSSLIAGLISKNPLKAVGLANSRGIKQYENLVDAKKDGCDTAYICSSNWTHFDWVKKALKTDFTVLCEKPIVTNREEFEELKKLSSKKLFGVMIKRAHPNLEELRNKKNIKLYSYSKLLNTPDYLDSRRGGFLFIELIHYVDIALFILGNDSKMTFEGNRVRGKITFSKKSKSVEINYDFDSEESQNSFPFTPKLIKSLENPQSEVFLNKSELIKLYDLMFKLKELQTSI